MMPAEQATYETDQHRVHGEVRDVAAPAGGRRVAVPRDALEISAVVARKGVPERAGVGEHGELQRAVEREHEVDEQREDCRDDSKSERKHGDAEHDLT
ncbi:MAG: hypothetical protein DMF99_02950 [Acidobacteria bacterium]|nr:MAG: hypothetical protein DMF99_02950 [Acidobacteriota bacterium]